MSNSLELDNDELLPADWEIYAMDGSGNKGWQEGGLVIVSPGDIPNDLSSKLNDGDAIRIDVDGTSPNGLTVNVVVQDSIEVYLPLTNNALRLVNDEASPGNNHFYGTQGAGTKGWNALTQVTYVTDVQLDGSNNLQKKTRTGYVWNPGAESGWSTITGWTTTDCT